jgi:hypothetical protein
MVGSAALGADDTEDAGEESCGLVAVEAVVSDDPDAAADRGFSDSDGPWFMAVATPRLPNLRCSSAGEGRPAVRRDGVCDARLSSVPLRRAGVWRDVAMGQGLGYGTVSLLLGLLEFLDSVLQISDLLG